MSDLVKRLRAGNNGQEIEAADKIEALEAEVARLTRHADAGWDQQRYWSGRYEESAKIRDAMDAQLTEARAGEDELAEALREIEANDDGTIDLYSPQELATRALASHAKRKEGR